MILAFAAGAVYEVLSLAWARAATAGRPSRTAAITFVHGMLGVLGYGEALRGGLGPSIALCAGYALAAYVCLRWGKRWI